jgi:hypothetical protein
MDPRAVLQPVGPLRAGVYWRRRLVLVVALVIVIVLIARACSGSSGRPSPSAGSQSATTTTSAPSLQPCPAGSLTAVASTDAVRYPAGAVPKLRVTIRTNRTTGCLLTVDRSAVTWSVYSGADLVWTTAQCPPSAKSVSVEVRPSHPVARVVSWDRHRSTAGCAATGRTEAQPGTYQLFVTLQGAKVGPAVFHLTG